MRPIDADVAKRIICRDQCELPDGCGASCEITDYIEAAPTIDAVEVVRCKDCRFGHIDYCLGETCIVCGLTRRIANLDGYCNEGVKRDAETD